jgi:SAM-dependent methyltransferase
MSSPISRGRPQMRRRTALVQQGGETWVAGEPALSELLAHALDVGDLSRDALTHGFHSYPARMHWATAARLLDELKLSGASVLDPFCGSGTTLVEACVRGAVGYGVDLSPFAVRLARVKSDPLSAPLRVQLRAAASEVRTESEALVQERAKVRAPLSPAEAAWYEPHVLKEMAGLFATIQQVDPPALREVLTFVFSALVIKFSRQRSDSAEEQVERRLRKGLVSEFFERKSFELAERLDALAAEVRGPLPEIAEGDARRLHEQARIKVDCIISSPPYGGTYDYAAHHARRFAWLGLPAAGMRSREIGARRHAGGPQRFADELRAALDSMRRVLARDGLVLLLMGDAEFEGRQRVPADELVASLAGEAGLRPLAAASQARPDFRGGPPRAEHLMALAPRP